MTNCTIQLYDTDTSSGFCIKCKMSVYNQTVARSCMVAVLKVWGIPWISTRWWTISHRHHTQNNPQKQEEQHYGCCVHWSRSQRRKSTASEPTIWPTWHAIHHQNMLARGWSQKCCFCGQITLQRDTTQVSRWSCTKFTFSLTWAAAILDQTDVAWLLQLCMDGEQDVVSFRSFCSHPLLHNIVVLS